MAISNLESAFGSSCILDHNDDTSAQLLVQKIYLLWINASILELFCDHADLLGNQCIRSIVIVDNDYEYHTIAVRGSGFFDPIERSASLI